MWHDRLGHPGSIMMRRIIENSHVHTLKDQKILQASKISCEACSLGKLIMKSSPIKKKTESPTFFECIQDDIVGLFTHCVDHFDTLWIDRCL